MPLDRLLASMPAALALLTLAALPLAASAQDRPTRKPGLWDTTISGYTGSTKNPEQKMQQCVDAASDQALQKLGSGLQCEKNESRKEGRNYLGHTVCQVGPSTLESRSVSTGDFDKEYTTTVESTFNPPIAGASHSKTLMVAKWLGPCKPGQKPGDTVFNGQKMNLLSTVPPSKP